MTNEPKSLSLYLAIAAVLVAPLLYFTSAHVDEKVAPVGSYVAQAYGAAQDITLVRLTNSKWRAKTPQTDCNPARLQLAFPLGAGGCRGGVAPYRASAS